MDIQGLASLSHCSEYPKALFPMMPYYLTKQFNDFFAEHEPRDWCELPGFRLWEEGVLCSQSLEASSEATHRKHFSITQILENFVWPDCLSNIEGVDGGLTSKGCEQYLKKPYDPLIYWFSFSCSEHLMWISRNMSNIEAFLAGGRCQIVT